MTWYTPEYDRIITEAVAGVDASAPPFLREKMRTWMLSLSGTDSAADYFKHPLSVPFLLIPWWAEEGIQGTVDTDFQAALAFSSVNAYYYVRLIDNIMDGDAEADVSLLPFAGIFHTQFQQVYQQYFASDHPFWEDFSNVWYTQADVTIQDSLLETIDEDTFLSVSSQKICGTKIPVLAVCHHYKRSDLMPVWMRFVEVFGRWHMMYQDMFDWHKDLQNQTLTFFLSEAQRRKKPQESVAAWIIREGVDQGLAWLDQQMTILKSIAAELNQENLRQYLEEREAAVQKQRARMDKGLRLMSKLAELEKRDD